MEGSHELRIEELNSLDAIRALGPDWNSLEERSDTHVPSLHPEYVALWLETLGRRATPRLITAWAGEELVGYAPFMETIDPFGPLSVRALKFVGNNVGYPGDILYADIVTSRNHSSATHAILQHARSAKKIAKWDLGFIAVTSPTLQIAADAIGMRPNTLEAMPSQPYVFLELPDSWEEFLAAHPRADDNYRRRVRRLEKIGTVRMTTEEQPDHVVRREGEMLDNHEKWWGTSFKGDWFGDHEVRAFLVDAAHLLATQGRYIIFTLELNGEPISWSTGVMDGDRFSGLQRSYNRSYATYSPGTLLDLFTVRYLLSKNISRVQMGPGLGHHKRVLGARVARYVQLRGYRGWRRIAVGAAGRLGPTRFGGRRQGLGE